MDKLDTESWEDYAFRNNLYKIKYSDKDVSVIVDIIIPTHTKITCRHYVAKQYIDYIDIYCHERPGFLEFIMYEIYKFKTYYKLQTYDDAIKVSPEHMSEQVDKDRKRRWWLFKEMYFWERQYGNKVKEDGKEKEKNRILNEQKNEDNKTRFIELKANISETHKEQLEEIICIMKTTNIRFLEGIDKNYFRKNEEQEWNKEYDEKLRIKQVEIDRKTALEKKDRIELYQKYLKNKDIQTQIIELEQKLTKLKSEIV